MRTRYILVHTPGQIAVVISSVLIAWQVVCLILQPPFYLLPPPAMVWGEFVNALPFLLGHVLVTIQEISAALIISGILGIALGVAVYTIKLMRLTLLPLLLIVQVFPLFALAPLLVLWFGYGMASKIACAVLITCFPVVLSTYEGLRRVPQQYNDFAASVGTPFWPALWRVKLPAALPVLAPGLKMAAVFAPLGAVLGEWVGSSAGLGYVMLQAGGRMRTALVFAALGCLAVVTMVLYASVAIWLHRQLHWHMSEQS